MKVSHKGKVYDVRAEQTKESPSGEIKVIGYITSGGVFAVSEVEVVEEIAETIAPAEGVSESAAGPAEEAPKRRRAKS